MICASSRIISKPEKFGEGVWGAQPPHPTGSWMQERAKGGLDARGMNKAERRDRRVVDVFNENEH